MTEETRLPRIRVAAIIVEDGQLLLVRHEKDGVFYWMLPGGGVDYGETLAEALQRELRDELCIEAEIGPLLLANDSIPEDRHRHIVNLYFGARIAAGDPQVGGDQRVVEAAFHPLDTLAGLVLRPAFTVALREAIAAKHAALVYLGNVWVDG